MIYTVLFPIFSSQPSSAFLFYLLSLSVTVSLLSLHPFHALLYFSLYILCISNTQSVLFIKLNSLSLSVCPFQLINQVNDFTKIDLISLSTVHSKMQHTYNVCFHIHTSLYVSSRERECKTLTHKIIYRSWKRINSIIRTAH